MKIIILFSCLAASAFSQFCGGIENDDESDFNEVTGNTRNEYNDCPYDETYHSYKSSLSTEDEGDVDPLTNDDAAKSSPKRCIIDVYEDLLDNHPHIYQNRSSGMELIYPNASNNSGILTLEAGDQYVLSCPLGKLNITNTTHANATCIEGKIFAMNGKHTSFMGVGCGSKTLNPTCPEQDHELIEILNPAANMKVEITVCFNKNNKGTRYSLHELRKSTTQTPSKQYEFKPGEHYPGINPLERYSYEGQFCTFTRLLGSHAQAYKFLKKNCIHKEFWYFNEGHLAPAEDFDGEDASGATYNYINVAPQWLKFNAGNWNKMENWVRQTQEKDVVHIATGTYGILSPNDKNGHPVKLYMDIGDAKSHIPVPLYFWKVLYDFHDDYPEGLAIVLLNDPTEKKLTKELCKETTCDIIEDLKITNFDQDYAQYGYMYCCTASKLRETVKYVPEFKNNEWVF